ncbi:MAG TPA: CBS domain-containing protein [Thermoanaerobaculia bacterium]|jgi:CBS domain-containing protein
MANENSRHIRDVMTPNPQTVTQKDSIADVARIMKDQDTGIVPVVDGKKIIGMITDRDIVVRGIAEGKDIANSSVSDVMTKHVRSVQEDTPIHDVLQMMSSAEIRRVPVVNRNDELVGIVSIGDIASDTNNDRSVGKALENISEAPPNN